MNSNSGILASNVSFVGSSAASAIQWQGGRTVIAINATAYGSGVFLQAQGPSGAWINVNASTYAADQFTAYDLPRGTYKLVSNASSSIGVYAYLANVPYS